MSDVEDAHQAVLQVQPEGHECVHPARDQTGGDQLQPRARAHGPLRPILDVSGPGGLGRERRGGHRARPDHLELALLPLAYRARGAHVLAAGELEAIIGEIRKTFALPDGVEITLEINPGSVTPGFLQALRRSGVSRLNVGVQSFDDGTLAFLGRRHTSRQAVETILLARG